MLVLQAAWQPRGVLQGAEVQRLGCGDGAASWVAFASGVFPKSWSLVCGCNRSRSFLTFMELCNDLSACLPGLYY